MNKIVLLLSFLLVSCASIPDAIVPPTEREVALDPRILTYCDPLVKLPPAPTFDDVLNVSLKNMELYYICADKQKSSVELLKKVSNRKE